MLTIAICDHIAADNAMSLIETLQERGHSVILFNQEDPCQVLPFLKRFRPGGIILDLYFQGKDGEKSAEEWWGFRVLEHIQEDDDCRVIPVVVRSGFLTEEAHKLLDERGIPQERRMGFYHVKLKEIAEVLESCVES